MKENNKNTVKITVNLNIYPLEAIYGASYVFIDRAYVFLEEGSSAKSVKADRGVGKVIVNFKAKEKTNKKAFAALEGEFLNELLNYTLRVSLEKNNKKIRQYVVERALYSSVGSEDEIWLEETFPASAKMEKEK